MRNEKIKVDKFECMPTAYSTFASRHYRPRRIAMYVKWWLVVAGWTTALTSWHQIILGEFFSTIRNFCELHIYLHLWSTELFSFSSGVGSEWVRVRDAQSRHLDGALDCHLLFVLQRSKQNKLLGITKIFVLTEAMQKIHSMLLCFQVIVFCSDFRRPSTDTWSISRVTSIHERQRHQKCQFFSHLEVIEEFQLVYCTKCSAYQPHRTHHCKVCQRCIMRMDHHCPLIQVGKFEDKLAQREVILNGDIGKSLSFIGHPEYHFYALTFLASLNIFLRNSFCYRDSFVCDSYLIFENSRHPKWQIAKLPYLISYAKYV